MDLNRIEVNNLPLTSYVSHTKDISAYVKSILNDITYYAPSDILNTSISVMLSSMSNTLMNIVRTLGGKVTLIDDGGQSQMIFIVRFLNDDWTLIEEQQIVAGQSAHDPGAAFKPGYVFTGWSTDFTNVQENLNVIAQYQKMSVFTVKFLDYNGAVLKNQEVLEGESATPPDDPSRIGYAFTGWDRSYENITSNIDIHATYSSNIYVVSFDANGGSIVGSKQQIGVAYGSAYGELLSAVFDLYKFTGWYLNDELILSSSIVNVATDHTLTAHWTSLT